MKLSYLLLLLSLSFTAFSKEPVKNPLNHEEEILVFKKEEKVNPDLLYRPQHIVAADSLNSVEFFKELELLENRKPEDHKVVLEAMGSIDSGSFSDYHTDGCTVKKDDITNEEELREDGLRRCNDGTVSFVQPKSTGICDAEGKCGQTSAANIMYMYCKLITSPKAYTNAYLSDYTPGVRPDTMKEGLNKMFNKNWKECPQEHGSWHYYDSYDYESDYIDAVERGLKPSFKSDYVVKRTRANGKKIKRTPVALLIRNPGGEELHWITVVDVIRGKTGPKTCHMVVNHWDDQYEVPCSKIAKWSRGVANSYGVLFNKYVVLKFK